MYSDRQRELDDARYEMDLEHKRKLDELIYRSPTKVYETGNDPMMVLAGLAFIVMASCIVVAVVTLVGLIFSLNLEA